MKTAVMVLSVLLIGVSRSARPDIISNYPDARAFALNNCPFVELSNFSFENPPLATPALFTQTLTWKNTGAQSIIAFEVVVLKYDAFNRRMVGSKWTVTGRDSADWRPLAPGESSKDGTRSYGTEEVFTAIAYVRTARLKDGTLWNANELTLRDALHAVAPDIKDFGDVKPDPKAAAR